MKKKTKIMVCNCNYSLSEGPLKDLFPFFDLICISSSDYLSVPQYMYFTVYCIAACRPRFWTDFNQIQDTQGAFPNFTSPIKLSRQNGPIFQSLIAKTSQ